MYIFTHQKYLSNNELRELYSQMRNEGIYDKVFYNDNHFTANAWISHIHSGCWLVRVTELDGTDVGVFWLSDFSGKAAFFHYWVFKAGWGAKDLQKETLGWLAEHLKGHITTLVGKTPASNRLAVRFLKRGGFKILGDIPDAIEFADGTLDNAVISYRRLTNEDL